MNLSVLTIEIHLGSIKDKMIQEVELKLRNLTRDSLVVQKNQRSQTMQI